MKERPILFSAPMVRAILTGQKTQTRRAAKPVRHPDLGNTYDPGALVLEHEPQHVIDRACPYGQPGDRLLVRETFFAYGRWETRFSAKKGRDEWHFIDMTEECGFSYLYAADNPVRTPANGRSPQPGWHRRPAIFMPRRAARIFLEVIAVRVERLQDISPGDAIAEGVERSVTGDGWRRYSDPETESVGLPPCQYPRHSYRSLWEHINGAESWDTNPWVWVVEFKRIEPPKNGD